MVVESTVAELRAGSELVVTGTPSDVARSSLEAMPEVEAVRPLDGALRVRVDERHTAAVTRTLVAAGVAVTEVRRDNRQLEDVFFEMTEHEIEEEEKEASHV
jgi:ABC-2 type transport system ATP-binding protein